ncbi:Integral membrane protein TerC family protein [compost metagenome]
MDNTFWVALVNIIIIDLVLSGDNAVVIAMAVQHLPKDIAKKAAIIGAAGAVGLRVIFTAMAAFLLSVPLLQAIGGAVLFWIAFKLLVEKEEDDESGKEVHGFWDAVKIIIMADVVMSLDNVLAVGGAAHGDLRLLLFGLALSIPLVLFGSAFLTTALRRWPALAYIGSGVLAWTAGRMIVHDKVVHGWLAQANFPMLDNLLPSLATAVILGLGYFYSQRLKKDHALRKAVAAESTEPVSEQK